MTTWTTFARLQGSITKARFVQLVNNVPYTRKTRVEKLGAEALIHKIPEVYQNPKSWVMTGTQGMFVYPQGAVEEKPTVGETLSGAAKLILQTLVRLVLGI